MGTNLLIHIPTYKEDLAYTFYLIGLSPEETEKLIYNVLRGNKKDDIALSIITDGGVKYILSRKLLEESVIVISEWDETKDEDMKKEGGYMVTIDGQVKPIEPFSTNLFDVSNSQEKEGDKDDEISDEPPNDWGPRSKK